MAPCHVIVELRFAQSYIPGFFILNQVATNVSLMKETYACRLG